MQWMDSFRGIPIMRYVSLKLKQNGNYVHRYNKHSGMVMSLFIGTNVFAVQCPACPRLPYAMVVPYLVKLRKTIKARQSFEN